MLELRLSYFVIMIAFDASTLILIAEIELLDIFLGAIKLKAAIPEEVARECYGAKKTLDALMIQKALDKSRMKVVAVKNKKLVAKLSADFSLGRGEAEAITLALKEKAQLVGIDDKNGINAHWRRTDVTRIPLSRMRGCDWRHDDDQDDEYPYGPR